MALIKIDFLQEFEKMYQDAGHPLGRTRRGRKKWLKRKIIQTFKKFLT